MYVHVCALVCRKEADVCVYMLVHVFTMVIVQNHPMP